MNEESATLNNQIPNIPKKIPTKVYHETKKN